MSSLSPALVALIRSARYSTTGQIFVSFIVPIVAYKNFDANGYEMGLLFSAQALGAILGSPVAGFLADKRPLRPRLVLWGSVFRAVNFALMYWAILSGSYASMLAVVFLLGIGASFFWSPMGATVADASHYENRSEAYGYYSQQRGLGIFFGSGLGFFIYGLAANLGGGPEWLYISLPLYGVANLFGGIHAYQLLPQTPLLDIDDAPPGDQSVDEFAAARRLVRIGFCVLLAIAFLSSLVGSLVAPFLQIYLLRNVSDDPIVVLLMFVPGGTLSMLLAARLGRLADRFQPVAWLTVTGLIGAFTTWFLINTSSVWQIMLLFTIDSTIVGSSGFIIGKLLSNISRNRRGTISGLGGMTATLGTVAGPLLGGSLWEHFGEFAPFYLSIFTEGTLALIYPIVFVGFGFTTYRKTPPISRALTEITGSSHPKTADGS